MLIDGEEILVDNWYMWRDHSWGIRPNVGGFDPFTGTGGQGTLPSAIRSGGKGLMLFGFGFSTTEFGGYNDGRGMGVYRSLEPVHEYDCYDVSKIGSPRLPDGQIAKSTHREQHCRTTINGKPGSAYVPLIILGDHHRYSLD
jgi:hypothetical protein